jgi:hypothetical protein
MTSPAQQATKIMVEGKPAYTNHASLLGVADFVQWLEQMALFRLCGLSLKGCDFISNIYLPLQKVYMVWIKICKGQCLQLVSWVFTVLVDC